MDGGPRIRESGINLKLKLNMLEGYYGIKDTLIL